MAAREFQVTHDVAIPQRVAEAGRVREQVAQRQRFLRRTQLRNALEIETGENLWRGERRVDGAGRLVQFQLAALDQLQCCDRCQQLDHRGDAENRIR